MTKTADSPLWDSKTFNLHHHWPRSSLIETSKFYFTRQPLRLLYEIFFITTFPIRVLLLLLPKAIYYRFLDLHAPKSRSFLSTISVFIGRSLIDDLFMPTGGGPRGYHYNKALQDDQRIKLLKKTKALPLVLGNSTILKVDQLRQPILGWAKEAGVNSAECLTTWWFGKRSEQLVQRQADKGEKILVYLSGGGYYVGTCYPTDNLGSLAPVLLKQIQQNVRQGASLGSNLPQSIVSLEYRRTGPSPTPSALIDALTLYYHLVNDLKFESSDISLMGDSAGGHLVNCVVRYLIEGGETPPGKIILISPWGDQAGTIIEHPDSSYQKYSKHDLLSDHFYHYCRDSFASKFANPNDTLLDIYFSPAAILGMVKTRRIDKNDYVAEQESVLVTKATEKEIFRNWPCTLLTCGDFEVLRDQSTEMLKRLEMSKREDGKEGEERELTFFTMETNHDPFIMPFFVYSRERREAIKRITAWMAL